MTSKAVLLKRLTDVLEEMDLVIQNEETDVKKYLETVPEKHREGLERFLLYTEADADFLAFWETDDLCQTVLREYFMQQVLLMERVTQATRDLVA